MKNHYDDLLIDDYFDAYEDYEYEPENCILCGEPAHECCICGAPLCHRHFETKAGDVLISLILGGKCMKSAKRLKISLEALYNPTSTEHEITKEEIKERLKDLLSVTSVEIELSGRSAKAIHD